MFRVLTEVMLLKMETRMEHPNQHPYAVEPALKEKMTQIYQWVHLNNLERCLLLMTIEQPEEDTCPTCAETKMRLKELEQWDKIMQKGIDLIASI